MAKEFKTSQELADLITGQVGELPIQRVEVYPEKAFGDHGWAVTAITLPQRADECQNRVEAIASLLRAKYDLKE